MKRGTRLNAMKRFGLCSLLWYNLDVLTFFPLTGDAQKVDAFIFLNTIISVRLIPILLLCVMTIQSRYLQHVHFIPTVGVEKRGTY